MTPMPPVILEADFWLPFLIAVGLLAVGLGTCFWLGMFAWNRPEPWPPRVRRRTKPRR